MMRYQPLMDKLNTRSYKIWLNGVKKTIIISAHRLSALVDATNILVLKQGEIIEQGTHQTLIAVPGWYQDMYHYQQLEAALDDDK